MAAKHSRRFRPLKRLLQSDGFQRLLAWLIAGYVWLVFRSTQWDEVGREHIRQALQQHGRVICVFWHQRLMMMPVLWQGGDYTMQVMASKHRDGALIGRVSGAFGIGMIQGSTGKGGASALRGAMQALKDGVSLGLTPDGPRGPREQVQPGAIALAKKTGVPIIPVAYSVSRGRYAQSWDRFLIPYPFGRGVLSAGGPIYMDGTTDAEAAKEAVETALKEMTAQADAYVGRKNIFISEVRE